MLTTPTLRYVPEPGLKPTDPNFYQFNKVFEAFKVKHSDVCECVHILLLLIISLLMVIKVIRVMAHILLVLKLLK